MSQNTVAIATHVNNGGSAEKHWSDKLTILTRLQQLIAHVLQWCHFLLLGGVNDQQDASQQAQQTAELPQDVQRLPQQVGGQNCTEKQPDRLKSSSKYQQRIPELYWDNHLMRTLRAPRGVTSVAGANMYAAKLHASPAPTADGNTRSDQRRGLMTRQTHKQK